MKTMILAALLALLAVPAFTGDTWGEDSARIEVSVIQEGPASGPNRSLVGGEPHYGTPPQCQSKGPRKSVRTGWEIVWQNKPPPNSKNASRRRWCIPPVTASSSVALAAYFVRWGAIRCPEEKSSAETIKWLLAVHR